MWVLRESDKKYFERIVLEKMFLAFFRNKEHKLVIEKNFKRDSDSWENFYLYQVH